MESKKSLYQILIELSESHCKFKHKGAKKSGYADLLRFDLDTKSISNGNIVILKDGKLVTNKIELADGRMFDLTDVELLTKDDVPQHESPYETIEELYEIYKTSVPSEHSQFSRQNFKALKSDNLSMAQIINNIQRIKAQYMLEAFIILASIKGWITWENDSHFYWQSKNDKELVLYKSWFN